MITAIIDWLIRLIDTLGYSGVALAMFIESFFPPIPSELILPFAGYLASKGSMDIYLLALIAGFASYLGSLPFYFIGRWGNKDKLAGLIDKYGKYVLLKNKDLEKGYVAFDKYGNWIVLFARLVPVLRSIISFPAGVYKMNFFIYSLFTLIGSVIWSFLLAFAGFLLKDKYEDIAKFISQYEKFIIVAIVLVVVVFVVVRLYPVVKKKNARK